MILYHLTDLHWRQAIPGTSTYTIRQSRRMPELLSSFKNWLHDKEVDAVLITGDLIDAPFEDEREDVSNESIEEDYKQFNALLQEFPCPVLTVAGNHDDIPAYQKYFEIKNKIEIDNINFYLFHDHQIGCEVPTRKRLHWNLFMEAMQDKQKQIHLQHYLIHPLRNDRFPHTYQEAEEMLTAIEASGKVILNCSGHYHQGYGPELYRGCTYSIVPSFSEEPFPFMRYEIKENSFSNYKLLNMKEVVTNCR